MTKSKMVDWVYKYLIFVFGSWQGTPNFLSDKGGRGVFCSNEITLGRILNSMELGATQQKEQALIASVELPAQHTILWGGRGDGDWAL